jgi:hypothetical protein
VRRRSARLAGCGRCSCGFIMAWLWRRGDELAGSDDLKLVLAEQRHIAFPVANGGLIDAKSPSQCRVAAEMRNGLICFHGR